MPAPKVCRAYRVTQSHIDEYCKLVQDGWSHQMAMHKARIHYNLTNLILDIRFIQHKSLAIERSAQNKRVECRGKRVGPQVLIELNRLSEVKAMSKFKKRCL